MRQPALTTSPLTPTMTTTPSPVRTRLTRPRQGGFNFAEVLFAVMILGIGFIMVAAIFPVAIQQTKTTGEEVVASTIARGGINYFQQVGLTAQALPATDLLLAPLSPAPPPVRWPNHVAAANDPEAATLIIPANDSLHLPGKMISFRDNRLDPDERDAIWRRVSRNLILPDDPRVAGVGMYRRGITYTNTGGAGLVTAPSVAPSADAFAHVVVIGVQIRNRSTYENGKDLYRSPTDINNAPAAVSLNPATLEPTPVYVKLTERQLNTGESVDTVTFYNNATAAAAPLGAAVVSDGLFAQGAHLVISDDQIADNPATATVYEGGQRNGRVYKLGQRREDLGSSVFELAPDGDLSFIDPDGTPGNADDVNENLPPRSAVAPNVAPTGLPAIAFMVGRGLADPAAPAGAHEGTIQDTGVYVTIVPAN